MTTTRPTLTVLDDYQGVALTSADWGPVRESHDVVVLRDHLPDEDAVVAALEGSEVVVVMRERTPLPASTLARLPRLRLLVTTGMRNAALDVAAATTQGVTVSGTKGSSTAVPELTIGMMIALMRGFAPEDAAVRSGGWQHTIGPGLAGRTLGIVGLGRLGVPVARLAHAFGMQVIAWSPNLTPERARPHDVEAVTKAELFERSDVVTLHLPLSDRSRGLVGADDLARMRPTAYLVNTSRGPIVDGAALLEALHAGRIAGAALDVYEHEPLPADDPWRSAPRTLLLPHIGYVTTDAYREWYGQVVEDVVAWRDGEPLRVITA